MGDGVGSFGPINGQNNLFGYCLQAKGVSTIIRNWLFYLTLLEITDAFKYLMKVNFTAGDLLDTLVYHQDVLLKELYIFVYIPNLTDKLDN